MIPLYFPDLGVYLQAQATQRRTHRDLAYARDTFEAAVIESFLADQAYDDAVDVVRAATAKAKASA